MKRGFQPGVYNRARLSNKNKSRRRQYLHSESVAAVSTRNNYHKKRKTKSVCLENETGEISVAEMASEEVENLFETCNDDSTNDVNSEDSFDSSYKQEEPENFTNFYHCVLMGINWWNHLKIVYPKIPNEINQDLQNELQNVDVEPLERTFGKLPHRKCLFLKIFSNILKILPTGCIRSCDCLF